MESFDLSGVTPNAKKILAEPQTFRPGGSHYTKKAQCPLHLLECWASTLLVL